MGGMAANIPNKHNKGAHAIALTKVREDKEREVRLGHDGTWVAHPGLVPIAKEIFDSTMPSANQVEILRNDLTISAQDLTRVPTGEITEEGVRNNIDIGIRYVEAWLNGKGAVPLYNLMEDAATAEISRAQIWQWIRHASTMSNGKIISGNLVKEIIQEELLQIKLQTGKKAFHEGKYILAAMLFEQLVRSQDFIEFLTLPAYDYL
jgi:malate synthase